MKNIAEKLQSGLDKFNLALSRIKEAETEVERAGTDFAAATSQLDQLDAQFIKPEEALSFYKMMSGYVDEISAAMSGATFYMDKATKESKSIVARVRDRASG